MTTKKERWLVVPKDGVTSLDTDQCFDFNHEPTVEEIVDSLDEYAFNETDYPDGCLIFKAVKEFNWPVTKGTISDI